MDKQFNPQDVTTWNDNTKLAILACQYDSQLAEEALEALSQGEEVDPNIDFEISKPITWPLETLSLVADSLHDTDIVKAIEKNENKG